jgi:hypothetical protein
VEGLNRYGCAGSHSISLSAVWLETRAGRNGAVLATSEQLLLTIDKNAGSEAARWRAETLDALAEAHRGLPVPKQAGKGIALKRGQGCLSGTRFTAIASFGFLRAHSHLSGESSLFGEATADWQSNGVSCAVAANQFSCVPSINKVKYVKYSRNYAWREHQFLCTVAILGFGPTIPTWNGEPTLL